MKHYFLGMAAGYTTSEIWRHTFTVGHEKDRTELARYLGKRYGGEAILCKNGRSALALALMAYFEPGDAVIVNGFTCYAVYEAVKAAGLVPVFVDIDRSDLNFSTDILEASMGPDNSRSASLAPAVAGLARYLAPVVANDLESSNAHTRKHYIKGIIVQNTLGNPINIELVERFAEKYGLTIIEDLAHCTGVRYHDGREVGTVGAAAVFSFGKDKSIDTISGGAVVLRDPCRHAIEAPSKAPRVSDHLRARLYPMLGAICRGLVRVKLGGLLMRLLVKAHLVERSADNSLDLTRKISKFEARLALEQFKKLKKSGRAPIREFCLVRERDEVLKRLRQAGYYFEGYWYERPVSPVRYYKRVHFPEAECPEAVYVAEHIVNLPSYYTKQELADARKIIDTYREEDSRGR